jgi:hypothetical protein
MKKSTSLLGLCIVVASLAIPALAGSSSKSTSSTADLLKGSRFLDHVRYLASDDLGGRGNGGRGLEEAARYIAARFAEFGLKPAGENESYFQSFEVNLGGSLGRDNLLELQASGIERPLRLHEDFEPMTFTGMGVVEAPVVFVGYSITAPEHEYDDYAGVDVDGKVVLMLRHVPREKRPGGPFGPDRGHATFVTKVVNAKRHKASAVLVINDPLNHDDDQDELLTFGDDLGAEDLDIPAVHIKQELASKLFEAVGRDLRRVQQSIDEELKPVSFELTSRAYIRVDITRKHAEVRNVLGYLPPFRADGEEEIVLIGGHYDHVGLGRRHSRATRKHRGEIHNGADDNASGTAGVMELARVFATRTNLERGVLFAAFAGEELGLLGSSHYTSYPTLPLDKTVAMINLDMIGRLRDDKLFIGGVETSPLFRAKLDELGEAENLKLSYSFSGYGSSDHTSFTVKEIPSLFFFTGLHGDYHKPSDDWQEINVAGAERVLRMAYLVADYIQGLRERPAFTQSKTEEGRAR